MKSSQTTRFFFITILYLCSFSVHAWNHSLEVGYGISHDPNHTKYRNSGAMLSSDLWSFYCSRWTHWSLNGSVGQWHTTTPRNRDLTSGALSLALRLYPFDLGNNYKAYVLAAAGPAVLSDRHFGDNTQASNLTIQSNAGLGFEFKCIDVNLRFEHFSNANLGDPNEGFNILYLLSVGYLF